MKKFEYQIVEYENPYYVPYLNKLGEEGWELVSVLKSIYDDYFFYLKREIEEPTYEVPIENLHQLKDGYCRNCIKEINHD